LNVSANKPIEKQLLQTHSVTFTFQSHCWLHRAATIFWCGTLEQQIQVASSCFFGTVQNLSLLERNTNWFIDGTFKVSPAIFCQVFTIHVLIGKAILPIVYVLLPDETE
jgi:hypothetical protein